MLRIAKLDIAAAALLTLAMAGAALSAQRVPAGLPASAALLLRYDADHDGVITKVEMEAGLKADFTSADMNGDGCLDPAEVRAENQARLTRDGAEASPLVDWNLDGCVDLREFGNTVRSYFELADKTKDGKVSMVELRGPSAPLGPRTGAAIRTGIDSAGSTTQTPTNPTTGLPY
jgi:Ca2+-binding EF-hand superfamily protein